MTVIDIKEVSKIMRVSVSHIRTMKDAPMFPRLLIVAIWRNSGVIRFGISHITRIGEWLNSAKK